MSEAEREGIVSECFRKRRYFLRQLFQSLPRVLLVFSQSTANAFIAELEDLFVAGDARPGDPLDELVGREIRLRYGALPDGSPLEARVVFSPHITGNPDDFARARDAVVTQLVQEARAGRLAYEPATGHLARSAGACVFCTMLDIGPCDYAEELRPLSGGVRPAVAGADDVLAEEKRIQLALLGEHSTGSPQSAWSTSDDDDEPAALRER